MSNAVHDGAGDRSHQTLHKLASWHQLPDYVRQADPQESLTPVELRSGAYANHRDRQFPCHTKAATFLSFLYWMEHRQRMPAKTAAAIRDQIRRFGTAHGITADLDRAQRERVELEKTSADELPDSDFALVRVVDGVKSRQYPLRNALETKRAAEWLVQYRDELPYRDRQMIADRVIEKAAAQGAAIPEDVDLVLQRTAGRGLYDPERAATLLENRGRLCKDAGLRERMFKIAADVRANPLLTTDPHAVRELAATVDLVDRTIGIAGRYGPELPRPEDVLFAAPIKVAESMVVNDCVLVTGDVYDRRQFSRLSPALLRESFGDRFVDAATTGLTVDPVKMASLATTLPLADARELGRLLRAAGQQPQHGKRAHIGPSDEEREALAKEYAAAHRLPAVAAGAPPSGVAGSRLVGPPV